MEEQPQESPTEQPAESSDGQPKFFKSMNGMIAGATALVVAFGGLLTAYDKFFGDKPAEKAAAAVPAEAQAPAKPAATADAATEPEQGDPLVYEGGGVRLEWADDEWLLTGRDGEFHYEDTFSSDETKVLGYDKANDAYLRWPIKGGMAEEGSSDKQTWTNYVELDPADQASD